MRLGVDQLDAEQRARQLAAEEDVGGDVAHAGEREVLVDHLDAGRADVAGVLADERARRRSGSRRRPARWTPVIVFISVDLPAPLSPTSADHRARLDRERDAAQRLDRAEILADVLELEQAHRRRPSALLMRSSQTASTSTAPMAIC